MPMATWIERAAMLTAEKRASDRRFHLMDGYCHLMTWAYRLHDSAFSTPESKLLNWYNDAGRAIQLLQSYLPVMLESIAKEQENLHLAPDELEKKLVATYADCKFSKTYDQWLPSQLIEWLINARNDLYERFEAYQQGYGDQDTEEEDDEEAEDDGLEPMIVESATTSGAVCKPPKKPSR
jgi:hypothetical protein